MATRPLPARLQCAAFLVILFPALVLQVLDGAYRSNLAGHPDESAHFVTGVCSFDYLTQALGSNPIAFAENYYVHFPKLAYGHWPPGFYGLQAIWYLIFGPSIASAILLMAVVVALSAWVLARWIQPRYGMLPAALSAIVFLALPLTRQSLSLVLADMLAMLLTMLAFFALLDALESTNWRSWFAFAAWTICAVLTKESALTLLALPPAAILLRRAPAQSLRRPGIILGSLAALALVVYAAAGVTQLREVPFAMGLAELRTRLPFLLRFSQSASPLLFLISAVGLFGLAKPHIRISLLLLTILLAAQVSFRNTVEERYFLPAFLPLLILFAEALRQIEVRFPRSAPAAVLLTVAIVATMPAARLRQRNGYDSAAQAIPVLPGGPVILISSSPAGEGGFIAERLTYDSHRAGIVLRASKLLSTSDWMGAGLTQVVHSPEQLSQLLDTLQVRYIVLGMEGFVASASRQHHRLLEATLQADPVHFPLFRELPLQVGPARFDAGIRIFENARADSTPSRHIQVDLTSSLGRQVDSVPGPILRSEPRSLQLAHLLAFLPNLPSLPQADVFRIDPRSDMLAHDGGPGRIYVTAPPGQSWTALVSDPWIHLRNAAGAGAGTVTYGLDPNASNHYRTGRVQIASAVFSVVQAPPPIVHLPFHDAFETRPNRWRLENYTGTAKLTTTNEGPHGNGSLRISKTRADEGWSRAQAFLPSLGFDGPSPVRLSLWMRTDSPGQIWIVYGQRIEPFRACGVAKSVGVSTEWRRFEFQFTPDTAVCTPDNSRLSIGAGEISGSLWIADVSLSVD